MVVSKTNNPQQPNPKKNPQQRRRNGRSQCYAIALYILLISVKVLYFTHLLCFCMICRNRQTYFCMPIIMMFVFSLVMQDQSFWSMLTILLQIEGLMKGFGYLDTFKNLFFQLKFIKVDKPVSVYFSKLWTGPKFICLVIYFNMQDFFFKSNRKNSILFYSVLKVIWWQITPLFQNWHVPTPPSKRRIYVNAAKLLGQHKGTYELFFLSSTFLAAALITLLYIYRSSGEKWQLSYDTSLENCHFI